VYPGQYIVLPSEETSKVREKPIERSTALPIKVKSVVNICNGFPGITGPVITLPNKSTAAAVSVIPAVGCALLIPSPVR